MNHIQIINGTLNINGQTVHLLDKLAKDGIRVDPEHLTLPVHQSKMGDGWRDNPLKRINDVVWKENRYVVRFKYMDRMEVVNEYKVENGTWKFFSDLNENDIDFIGRSDYETRQSFILKVEEQEPKINTMTLIPTETELYMQAMSEIDTSTIDTYLAGLQQITGMTDEEKETMKMVIQGFGDKYKQVTKVASDERVKESATLAEGVESKEEILQRAITLLLEHADGDFVSKQDALDADCELHNLMIKERELHPLPSKSLAECQSEFWNYGYSDYNLSTNDKEFDDLDSEVVGNIFEAGWDAHAQQFTSAVQGEQWIKVSERLPEENTNLLCIGSGGSFKTGRFDHTQKYFSGDDSYNGITHWRELPEKPKD